MLAFRDYHSLIEIRRYIARFMMHDHGMTHLQGILHTEFNEYDSLIKPIHVWLKSLGSGSARERPSQTSQRMISVLRPLPPN